MRYGYTKGLVSYGGNRRIFGPQGDPLSLRVSDCVALDLSNPSRPTEKELILSQELKDVDAGETATIARPVSREG